MHERYSQAELEKKTLPISVYFPDIMVSPILYSRQFDTDKNIFTSSWPSDDISQLRSGST